MSTASPSSQNDLSSAALEPPRLLSLDAMRGFDMFWIIGGAGLFRAIIALFDNPGANEWAAIHTEHPLWNGYTAWDQIFPMFMFIAGVAMPFSLTKRIERGEGKGVLYAGVIRRGLLLVLLGTIYNGVLRLDFDNEGYPRYPSVLGRIGLSYLFAALIVLNTRSRGQILWIVGILIGYWAAMKWIPVPEFGAGDWAPGHTLSGYIDRMIIPGKLYEVVRDPEGLFSTIPSIATVLFGALAGNWLRSEKPSGHQKTFALLVAAGLSLLLAVIWDGRILLSRESFFWFPVNKNLWTSSFVLYTTGWSLIVLSFFYLIIDVWGFKRWSFFFVVIGMNAITVYLVREFIDWPFLGDVVFNRALHKIEPSIVAAGQEVVLEWLMLFILFRQRIFLRV